MTRQSQGIPHAGRAPAQGSPSAQPAREQSERIDPQEPGQPEHQHDRAQAEAPSPTPGQSEGNPRAAPGTSAPLTTAILQIPTPSPSLPAHHALSHSRMPATARFGTPPNEDHRVDGAESPRSWPAGPLKLEKPTPSSADARIPAGEALPGPDIHTRRPPGRPAPERSPGRQDPTDRSPLPRSSGCRRRRSSSRPSRILPRSALWSRGSPGIPATGPPFTNISPVPTEGWAGAQR